MGKHRQKVAAKRAINAGIPVTVGGPQQVPVAVPGPATIITPSGMGGGGSSTPTVINNSVQPGLGSGGLGSGGLGSGFANAAPMQQPVMMAQPAGGAGGLMQGGIPPMGSGYQYKTSNYQQTSAF